MPLHKHALHIAAMVTVLLSLFMAIDGKWLWNVHSAHASSAAQHSTVGLPGSSAGQHSTVGIPGSSAGQHSTVGLPGSSAAQHTTVGIGSSAAQHTTVGIASSAAQHTTVGVGTSAFSQPSTFSQPSFFSQASQATRFSQFSFSRLSLISQPSVSAAPRSRPSGSQAGFQGGDFGGIIGTTGGNFGGTIGIPTVRPGGGRVIIESAEGMKKKEFEKECKDGKLKSTCIPLIAPLGEENKVTIHPGPNTFIEYFNQAVELIMTLSVGFAVLWILIGSFFIMVSGSDSGKRGTGKSMITWALIGLIIVNFAGFFLRTLNNIFFI